jgi:hypothetical protein
VTKEESKIVNEFLSKTLKIDAEELATLYNEAGELTSLQPAFDADALRIKKQAEDRNSQYNRGLKEGASKVEKEIKSKYEVDSELVGVELVDSIVLSKVEETKGATKDISKHPEMLKARLEWEKEQKKRDDDWKKQLEAKDVEFAQAKLKETVRNKGLQYLDEFKPILNPDPVKATHWKEVYLNELLSNKFKPQDGDDPVVVGEDDQPLKDPHGYARKLKEFAKGIADKYFDYEKAEQRSNAGNTASQGQKAGMPKDEDEAYDELRNPNITPERRIEITNFLKEKR